MKRNKMTELLRLAERLAVFGFTADEVAALLKIERTLHRWAELECGTDAGHIERDEKTGKALFFNARARYIDPRDPRAWSIVPDREAGALKRLGRIMAGKRGVVAYHQGDPRGCALYIVPTASIPKGARVDSCYTNGIAVCIG
jgi:hypothetical protein